MALDSNNMVNSKKVAGFRVSTNCKHILSVIIIFGVLCLVFTLPGVLFTFYIREIVLTYNYNIENLYKGYFWPALNYLVVCAHFYVTFFFFAPPFVAAVLKFMGFEIKLCVKTGQNHTNNVIPLENKEPRKLIMSSDSSLNIEKEGIVAGKGVGPAFAEVLECISKALEATPNGSCTQTQDSVQVLMTAARLWSVAPPSSNTEIAAIWMNAMEEMASEIEKTTKTN